MKIGTALINGSPRLVAPVNETQMIDLADAHAAINGGNNGIAPFGNDIQSFIRHGVEAISAVQAIFDRFSEGASEPFFHSISGSKLMSPIPRPFKNIECVGRNYREHVAESKQLSGTAQPIPEHPIFFSKPYTSVIGHEDTITFTRSVTEKVDYEGELVAVIGRQGKDIAPEKAMDYVFGYTLMNDVSARDLQYRHVQFYKGKSLDTFAPLGPWIVLKSAIADYRSLQIQTHVNGEIRQSAYLSELIFDIPTLISVLSMGMTLNPGDMIATGTPSGVGGGFNPSRFLKDGDVVEISIDQIGTLRNRVKEL